MFVLALPPAAEAYGPAGHAIAGTAAETLLCDAARDEIAELAYGAGLAEIGRWADTVRSRPGYEQSAPWHYMNVPNGGAIDTYRSPPEGDVLEAIERFRARLADLSLARAARLDALRFLTHFVVDVHQPLHVGRASDRGGNALDVVHDGQRMNLHRFWDSAALAVGAGGVDAYVDGLLPLVRRLETESSRGRAADWADESLDLRPWVYSFDPGRRELSERYVIRAEVLSRMRLAQAAVRLAATLNAVFCVRSR